MYAITTMAPGQQNALAELETTTNTALADFLAAMAGPVEGIELSPDYHYDWHNWSNSNP
jgi:hypothetical protein